jgi:murein DD-endopeptidase MepM/ murein hydrolase activator NlpD
MQKQYNHNLELERKERELLEKEIENLSFQISRSINEKKDTSEIPVDTYIYAPILSPLDFDELIPDIFPVRSSLNNYISSLFGIRKNPVSGRLSFHRGIDIVTDWKGWIIATATGEIVESSWDEFYGYYILIKHADGIYTRYAHLDDRYYYRGDYIRKGTIIGRMGNTGYTDGGAHLHYEIFRVRIEDGHEIREYIDPMVGDEYVPGISGYLPIDYILDVNNRILDKQILEVD